MFKMTNLLDQNPIYCVEQILIPEGLPTMLKTFAKEAIRKNPKELETFAWKYFEKLAATVKLDDTAPPPTIPQIINVWERSRDIEFTNQEPMRRIMTLSGIASNTCENVFKLADFPSDLIDPKEVIIILITSSCKSFVAIMKGIFKVFGVQTNEKLPCQLFFMLINFIARRNKEILATTISALHQDMKTKQIKEIKFEDISNNPIMTNLMKIA